VPPGLIAATLNGGQLSMARNILDEMQQESRTWAKDQVKPRINLALADQAIGATAKAATPAAPAGKAK
jgi:hypothetical protein